MHTGMQNVCRSVSLSKSKYGITFDSLHEIN